jgi:hypothetical protein
VAMAVLAAGVMLSILLWAVTHKMQPIWPNVPPAPSAKTAPFLGLGDAQLAYRNMAYQLQVIGNTSGQSTPLYKYDYNRLGHWFQTLHHMDGRSDYVPYLAAYYFGATQDPKRQLPPVIDYLEMAGSAPYPGKWRWLAQATFQAYHKRGDHARGMELAHKLAALPQPDMPHWAKQMPAIVAGAKGDKETAVRLMSSILMATLHDPFKKPDPVEINFMVDFICNRMLTKPEAAKNDLCQIPQL